METKKAIENIKEIIYTEGGTHWHYIDIDNTIDDECENFICSIEKVLQDLENYKIVTKKQINYLDKQIRCYDRKINNILELKNQGRNLTSKEKKQLKYELGRKDECVKMKNHLIKLIKNIKEEA